MQEVIRVQIIDGQVCLVVTAYGREAVMQLSLSGAEYLSECLERAVRLVERIEMQASGG